MEMGLRHKKIGPKRREDKIQDNSCTALPDTEASEELQSMDGFLTPGEHESKPQSSHRPCDRNAGGLQTLKNEINQKKGNNWFSIGDCELNLSLELKKSVVCLLDLSATWLKFHDET